MKPFSTYEDWIGSTITLVMDNGKVLDKIVVVDMWLLATGQPHSLSAMLGGDEINIPYERVLYYVNHADIPKVKSQE